MEEQLGISTDLFFYDNSLLLPSLISIAVSLTVSYFFKRTEIKKSAEVAYEFEQKKKIKEAIGRHIGRLLITAERLDDRLINLAGHYNKGWLAPEKPASSSGYYFTSTVQRLLGFYEIVYAVEEEAITLDARRADPRDDEFLSYVAIFQWAMRDIEVIFNGLEYDRNSQRDHLYADTLRDVVSRYRKTANRDRTEAEMRAFLDSSHNRPLLDFLTQLSPTNTPKRWDRLIILHLLINAFEDSFGHRRHARSHETFSQISSRVNEVQVLGNFKNGIRMFGLQDSRSMRKLIDAIDATHRSKTGSFLQR